MLDDLRNYLQMASGLTEATTSKAKEVVTGLLASGASLTAKAVPAPEMMGQVQELADDLVATSKNNRDMLTGMIRAEVDRAVGRMGFVREDELAALRRHVQRLEKQVADLEVATAAPAPAPVFAVVETVTEVVEAVVEVAPADAEVTPPATDEPSAEQAPEVAAPEVAAPDEAGAPAEGEPLPKKKKKKIIVDPSAGA